MFKGSHIQSVDIRFELSGVTGDERGLGLLESIWVSMYHAVCENRLYCVHF